MKVSEMINGYSMKKNSKKQIANITSDTHQQFGWNKNIPNVQATPFPPLNL